MAVLPCTVCSLEYYIEAKIFEQYSGHEVVSLTLKHRFSEKYYFW